METKRENMQFCQNWPLSPFHGRSYMYFFYYSNLTPAVKTVFKWDIRLQKYVRFVFCLCGERMAKSYSYSFQVGAEAPGLAASSYPQRGPHVLRFQRQGGKTLHQEMSDTWALWRHSDRMLLPTQRLQWAHSTVWVGKRERCIVGVDMWRCLHRTTGHTFSSPPTWCHNSFCSLSSSDTF